MEVAGRVLHGTCGWSDPSIVSLQFLGGCCCVLLTGFHGDNVNLQVSCGRFYPGSAKTSAEKLEVHSRTFGCVEVCVFPSVLTCDQLAIDTVQIVLSSRKGSFCLPCISSLWALLQVDSSLYSIPSAFNVQKWVDSVPRGYVFHFKAFGLFCGSSQGCPTNALPRRVREQLAPHLLSKPTVTLKDLPQHAVKSIWAAFGACIEPAVKARHSLC